MKRIILFALISVLFVVGCGQRGARTVKLDNGITVVLIPSKNSAAASVNVFIRTGSIDEKPSQAGLSHFIEHLMFKGSKNYPGDMLSRNTENLGGYINAMTSKDFTRYYIDIQKDGVETAIRMLADAMANPLFPQDEIDRERKVVIEEIKIHLDNPGSVLFDKFCDTIFKQSAMKNSVIGFANVIASVSRDEIYGYYSTHYVPEKMVVVIAGNFDASKALKVIKETFGKIPSKPVPADPNLVEEPHAGEDLLISHDVQVAYMISSFMQGDMYSDDIYTADLASIVLGGGKSSRLYRVLKEDKQLVFSIGASSWSPKGTGVFYVYSVFDPKNLDAVKKEIALQIENIILSGVTEEELARAKAAIETGWSFGHEKPADIGHETGYWTAMGKPEYMSQYLKKIDAVTAKDIQKFFAKYYSKEKVSNIALMPKGGK